MFVSYKTLGYLFYFLSLFIFKLKNKLYNAGFTVETVSIFIESKSTGIYFEYFTF